MKINKYDGIFYMHIVVMFMFVFRSLFIYIGLGQLVYVLSLVLVIVNALLVFPKNKKIVIRNYSLFLYVIIGTVAILFSLVSKGVVLTGMGYAALFLNLLIWKFAGDTIFRQEHYSRLYLKLFTIAMILNIIIAIYQFFVDASVFGIVQGVYGNEEILGYAHVTRRAVGFMESPQSFAASCGITLFACNNFEKKRNKFCAVVLTMIGGLLSGSRAFGLFVIIYMCYVTLNFKPVKRVIWLFTSAIALLAFYIVTDVSFFTEGTLFRNFDFTKWAALDVYFTSFSDFKWYELLFGKGYGLPGWKVMVFDYSATESFLISVLYQLGIVAVILFLFAYWSMYRKNRNKRYSKFLLFSIFLNLCCTPAFAGFAFSYLAWPMILLTEKDFPIEDINERKN